MTRTTRTLLAALACAALAGAAVAAPAGAKPKLKKIGKFKQPTYVASAPGTPGVLVVEQPGRVISVNGKKRKTFLDIRGTVKSGGEQGLLSVAFPPDYRATGLFYAYYTAGNGDLTIAEFRRASTFKADNSYRRVLLSIPHPGPTNHNGGQLQFGPDGLLYAGTGDGGGEGDSDNSAQTTDNLLGKIIRIDPHPSGTAQYTAPNDNPFTQGDGKDEIFAIGLRNPFRFSFDGDNIVIGDVGQNEFEEIDYLPLAQANGANFGWNDFEGFAPYSGGKAPPPTRHDKPIFAYNHSGGRCTVISGYVSHAKHPKALRGKLIYGDFCEGQLRALRATPSGASANRKLGLRVEGLSSFGLGQGGSIYAASQEGPVYKITGK